MSGCKKAVKDFISTIDNSVKSKLFNGISNGVGRRLYPSRTPKNDRAEGFRVDQGHVHNEAGTIYDIVLQPNAEATKPAVKEFIGKYSTHAKLAKTTIDKSENNGKGPSAADIRAALLADFDRRDDEEDFD